MCGFGFLVGSACALGVAIGMVGVASARPPAIARPEFVAQGFAGNVTGIVGVPGDRHRLFFITQQGMVRAILDGELLPDPVLDLTATTNGVSECGLLGIAPHPLFESNGLLYVYQSHTSPTAGRRNTVFEFRMSGDPRVSNRADLATQRQVIRLLDTFNHNGGWIGFGPDGMLYISVGEGQVSQRARDPSSLGGKLLRIDVDGRDPGLGYAIPASNPYAPGNPIGIDPLPRAEIWALGLRNPWRCSFDRVTGDLWIGDVGAETAEEVNVERAGEGGGLNYGWDCVEGFQPTPFPGCDPLPSALTGPIVEVLRQQYPLFGTMIGGYVYRGGLVPRLYGTYVFAPGAGEVFGVDASDPPPIGAALEQFHLYPSHFGQYTFGEDVDGELYGGTSGKIYQIVAIACGPADLTAGSDPSARGYGTPNGVLDDDDFWYFLQEFTAGNAAAADMTTTAMAGSAGYGVPDGVISNDDFFYYLSLFAAGC